MKKKKIEMTMVDKVSLEFLDRCEKKRDIRVQKFWNEIIKMPFWKSLKQK